MSGGGPPFEVTVTHDGLDALARALRAESDGKQLRKELAKNMRDALKPAASQAKSGIMAMSSSGPGTAPALRSAIAKKIRPEVKLGGNWSGARIKAFKTRNIRGFANAPKRTNRARGWRHLTYGREPWVQQHGRTLWFDRAMEGDTNRYSQAVHDAMEAMARRISDRAG
jgi:gas vesicle protein